MDHCTQTLDISDDDESSSLSTSPSKGDKCNKENVAPADYHPRPVSRRDAMTDEVRSPLGDLLAQDFYAEGCGADSFVLVSEEEEGDVVAGKAESLFDSNAGAGASGWEGILGQMGGKDGGSGLEDEDAKTEIVVWESESAKDEAEAVEEEANVAVGKVIAAVA